MCDPRRRGRDGGDGADSKCLGAADRMVWGAGAKVVLVPPEQSADLRDYYSKHAKNDRLDSRILARLPLLHPEGLTELDSLGPAYALKRVVRRRSKLVKRRTAGFQRLVQCPPLPVVTAPPQTGNDQDSVPVSVVGGTFSISTSPSCHTKRRQRSSSSLRSYVLRLWNPAPRPARSGMASRPDFRIVWSFSSLLISVSLAKTRLRSGSALTNDEHRAPASYLCPRQRSATARRGRHAHRQALLDAPTHLHRSPRGLRAQSRTEAAPTSGREESTSKGRCRRPVASARTRPSRRRTEGHHTWDIRGYRKAGARPV